MNIIQPSTSNNNNNVFAINNKKKLLLLMGMRRCGKSSIQHVVFHKMAPNETIFLGSNSNNPRNNMKGDAISFVDFQVWDLPVFMEDQQHALDETFKSCGAIVYVVDVQNDYFDALKRLLTIIIRAHRVNPSIYFEVFVHKVDGLSDDHKIEMQSDIRQRITEELIDANLDNVRISFYLTTIYDHSIFEAFSKVIQKLIPQLPTLENLLNILCSNSGIEKAFLFDLGSKIYIATDSSPVDTQSYELCSDMIDTVLDISTIYSRSLTNLTEADEAYATIRLTNGMVLYLREVNTDISLIGLIREENFEKQGLIDFNFHHFRQAVCEVLNINASSASSSPRSLNGVITSSSRASPPTVVPRR